MEEISWRSEKHLRSLSVHKDPVKGRTITRNAVRTSSFLRSLRPYWMDFLSIQPDFILTVFPETPDSHYSCRFVAKSPESGFLVKRISLGISAYVSWRITGAKTPRFIPDHTLLAIRHRLFFRTRDEHEEHSSESAIVAEALMNNVG